MSREFKFRTWDTINKTMVWPEEIEFYSDNTFRINGGWVCPGSEEDYIVMQFTGLKDKNGREIWEGDILKEDDCDSLYELKFGLGKMDGGVYKYMGFYLDEINYKGPFDGQGDNEYWIGRVKECFEVIGNVYENPDLLR